MKCAGAIAALLLLLGACEFGPVRKPDAVDPATYSRCDDREVMALLHSLPISEQASADKQKVLNQWRSCVDRCPDLVPAHIGYQDLALELGGDAEREMVEYYAALADRDSPVPAYLRARLAETAYDQANALDSILAEHDSFAWGHLSRARVHRGQGRLLEAMQAYEYAILYDPALAVAVRERAQVLAELGRFDEAAVGYRKYLRDAPEDLDAAREFVTLLLYRLDRVGEARERIRALRAAGDNSVGLRMDNAAALWRDGRPEAAIEEYLGVMREPAEVAAADGPRAALNVGLIYYEVVVENERDRVRFWPRARAAFRWFLAHSQPSDGHEQFERTFGVPYRLRRIAEVLGPAPDKVPEIDSLRWSG